MKKKSRNDVNLFIAYFNNHRKHDKLRDYKQAAKLNNLELKSTGFIKGKILNNQDMNFKERTNLNIETPVEVTQININT